MAISRYLAELRALVGNRPLHVPSVSVAVRDGSRYLLGVHEDHRRWVFPGGAVDPGEQPSDAAVRETWEETGLTVGLTRLVGCFGGPHHRIRYPNGDVVDYVSTVFEAEPVAGTLGAGHDELTEFGWYSLDEIRALPTAAWVPEIVDALTDPARTHAVPTWLPPSGEAP